MSPQASPRAFFPAIEAPHLSVDRVQGPCASFLTTTPFDTTRVAFARLPRAVSCGVDPMLPRGVRNLPFPPPPLFMSERRLPFLFFFRGKRVTARPAPSFSLPEELGERGVLELDLNKGQVPPLGGLVTSWTDRAIDSDRLVSPFFSVVGPGTLGRAQLGSVLAAFKPLTCVGYARLSAVNARIGRSFPREPERYPPIFGASLSPRVLPC